MLTFSGLGDLPGFGERIMIMNSGEAEGIRIGGQNVGVWESAGRGLGLGRAAERAPGEEQSLLVNYYYRDLMRILKLTTIFMPFIID